MTDTEYDDLDHTNLDALQDGDEATVRDHNDDEWTAVLREGLFGALKAHGYIVRYGSGKPGKTVTILSARRPRPPMKPLPDVPCVLIATVRGVPDVVFGWGGNADGLTTELIGNARWHAAEHIAAWRHLTADDLPRLRGEGR